MRFKKQVSLLAILISAFTTFKCKAQPAFIRDSLDAYVARAMKDWNIPGMAICIVKDNKIVVSKGYGVRDIKTNAPVNEETLFMIASNSKAFTATAVSLLENEKRLSLEDKVIKYFPWFKLYDENATKDVTVRDLLCHRIGLKTFQGDFLNWASDLTRKQIIEKMSVQKPFYPFRYQYGYCNAAYLTAGEIIPVVTDTSWDDFLKYRFFIPLKMNRTSTTCSAIANDKNAARPYTIDDDKLYPLTYTNIDNLGPAASINSCVKDLANWLLFQLDSARFEGTRLMPFSVLEKTRTPNTLINQLSSVFPSTHFSAYGLGWKLSDYAGRKIIVHDGGADGFVTNTCIVPEENLGIVVLTNTEANSIYDGLRRQVIDAYLNQPYRDYNEIYFSRVSANRKRESDANAILQKKADEKIKTELPAESYAGTYLSSVYGKMEIKVEKGVLVMHFEHHGFLTGALSYLGDNNFLCRYSDPVYGTKQIPFSVKDKKVENCTVTVNDFIDMTSYEFRKMN